MYVENMECRPLARLSTGERFVFNQHIHMIVRPVLGQKQPARFMAVLEFDSGIVRWMEESMVPDEIWEEQPIAEFQ